MMTCGRCDRSGHTTHVHVAAPGPYIALDCAYAGHAYDPDACDGDDLCDDCLAALYGEDEDGCMVARGEDRP